MPRVCIAIMNVSTDMNKSWTRQLVEEVNGLKSQRLDLNERVKELEGLLEECFVTMRHAGVFIRTREKMHPDGITLYDELQEKVNIRLKKK